MPKSSPIPGKLTRKSIQGGEMTVPRLTRPALHRLRSRRLATLAATGAVVTAAMLAPGAGAAAPVRACTAAHTEVWLGDGPGGGTLGTTFYPLEFSNIGHRTCTLSGYPRVFAYGASGQQIGLAADHNTGAHGVVMLAPGKTAHALLGIHDWGAICSTEVAAEGLRVLAPGQHSADLISFPFGACAHSSVLTVGPVRAGVGIPGFTTS
jgi:hypothetical protein